VSRPQSGPPAAVFFPLGYPFPYGPAPSQVYQRSHLGLRRLGAHCCRFLCKKKSFLHLCKTYLLWQEIEKPLRNWPMAWDCERWSSRHQRSGVRDGDTKSNWIRTLIRLVMSAWRSSSSIIAGVDSNEITEILPHAKVPKFFLRDPFINPKKLTQCHNRHIAEKFPGDAF
jgi:hypothetical protein